jgi:hypothetical protein
MTNVRAGSIHYMAIIASAVLIFATSGSLRPAVAETVREACTHDALKLCSDTIPDVERTQACLARNRSALSPLCKSAFPRSHGHRQRRRHV